MLIIFFILSVALSLLIFFAKNKAITKITSAFFISAQLFISIYAFVHNQEMDSYYYKFDALGILLCLVLMLLSLATFYHSYLYFKRHNFTVKQEAIYYASLIMLIAAMISTYFAENIALLWVSIEATTLFVTLLIFHERSKDALEAAWKYLFISSLGVAIAFIGILFISIAATKNGISNLSLAYLISIAGTMSPVWLKIAFLLVLTGFSAKMGVFPLYTGAVDAHTVAPPPISAFISTTLMNVGFLGIFRVYSIISHTEVLHWSQNILLITGVLSVFMSTIQMVRIKHHKRMFAFSSLEHMGIAAIGMGIGGLGYYAAILHLVFHSFVKASLFYQMGQVHQFFKSYWIKDTGNYFILNPVGGLAVILGAFSILAIPPSGLFVSEFFTFKALFLNNHFAIGIFLLILLTIITYLFLKNTFHLLYNESHANENIKGIKANPYEPVSQFILLGLVIYLGINPPPFFNELINAAVSVLN